MIVSLNRAEKRCRRALRAARLLIRLLYVGLRGLYRSWRAHDPTRHPAFRRARYAAYRQLWAKLETVYWKLRGSNCDASTPRALLRDANVFLTENCLYIREADQGLLAQYVLLLQRLAQVIHPTNENVALAVWEGVGGPTPGMAGNIDGVTQDVVGLRNRVLLQIGHAFPAE